MKILSLPAFCCTLLLSGQLMSLAQTSDLPVSTGTLQKFHCESKYVEARDILVWLPEGFDPAKKYAVLYMHDGQMLFDPAQTWNKQEWMVDETMGQLLREKKIRETIVVGIPNNGEKRRREYFPQKIYNVLDEEDQEKYLALAKGEPESDNYLKFLVSELIPSIDDKYPTFKTQESTFIAGSSMGGLISLYAICEYPDVFHGAACLSTHWTGLLVDNEAIPNALVDYLKEQVGFWENNKIYFDHGTEGLDALYGAHQKRVDAVLKEKLFPPNLWMSKVFAGEDHSEKAWAKRLAIPLQFLLAP